MFPNDDLQRGDNANKNADERGEKPSRPSAADNTGGGPVVGPAAILARPRIGLILVAIIAIAAVVVAALNAEEIGVMAAHAANAHPAWLMTAVISQCAAFFCTALAWRLVLRRLQEPISISALYPLSIAKLFADQALPSGGLSGAAFLLHALKRRGVSWDNAYTAFIFGAATFIAAFLIATFISFVAVAGADNAPRIITIAARMFYIILIIAVIFAAGFATYRWTRVINVLSRIPMAVKIMTLSQNAIHKILNEKPLFAKVVGVQIIQRIFDALTLWLIFQAIDAPIAFAACFIGVSLASVTATVAPTPMGVGAFEGGLVAGLAVFGVPIDTALIGTLIYRGLSLWLPLIPGFFILQRELLHTRKSAEGMSPPSASL